MDKFYQEVLQFALKITAKVGPQLMLDFGQVQAEQKADGSLVTKADQWSDLTIRNAIATTFPDHGVLTEETKHTFDGEEWCWIIDPLDGTTNFTRGIPIWGISLALLHNGIPVFGCVHLPPINQTFHGFYTEDKSGAFLNNRPIQTSKEQPTKNHFFSLCARSTEVLKKPFPCKIRMLGVATYNFLCVGAGITLGGVEATPKIWDLAAVWVILKAAGAQWIYLDKKEIFPLQTGVNYGNISMPTLVVSQENLVSLFYPLVEFLGHFSHQ